MTSLIRLAGILLLALGFQPAVAGVLNMEFKFTPFVGDPQADHVESVPGKAWVFINNIPVADQEIEKQRLPVLFDAREIAPSVWIPVTSLGPVVRKGKNRLRIEFEPAQATPYQARLSWAQVTDQVSEQSEAGRYQATNQAGEGRVDKQGKGKLSFEHEFSADFAVDRPWHHYPPVSSLSEADKQGLAGLVKSRVAAYKPNFAGMYKLLEGKEGIDAAAMRKAKCLEKAHAAGVRVVPPAASDLDFVITGNPEVVLKRKDGPLFDLTRKALARIKGEEMQMCAAMALFVAYPPTLMAVRGPDGQWQVAE
ncbi:MAG: hypothetical protein WC474_08100 [Hydrogenophilaceae bacterium]